ncbi:hypothetical protein nbrc107696_36070 [Gordonia spumicola]|uniref:Gamma-glutamylcyclotransferase AIG2-like domain-containing protein n=1 Tax=Gordonia spumicola TaxID=589161 RepID=A0A7I9VDC7_9ACTN|nr:gamma-glutamylcyclotransferase family protein [Gordonia spumicola]GEE03161.1 hypothetical protein nbrc107696_36070 [Gordonia spumicola]
MTHLLFSYGTLRQPDVQATLFGGPVPTDDDSLVGFRLDWVRIADPAVIAASGSDRHPILRRGEPSDVIAGSRLSLTDDQLAAADDYEVDDYRRVEAALASGRRAWVYVSSDTAD